MALESQFINQETAVPTKTDQSSLPQVFPKEKCTSSELVPLTPIITVFSSAADGSLLKTDRENIDELPVNQEIGSFIVVEELAQVETEELEKNTISIDNEKKLIGEVKSIVVSLPTSAEVYSCGECSYSSHNKHYLKQHVDLVHTSQRPYKCPFCDYAGKRSYSLKEHLIVHSNDWPYQCAHCNATFRKKGHLTNHSKMHTGILVFQCTLCEEQVYTSKEVDDLIQSSASSQRSSASIMKTEPFKISGNSTCSQNLSGKHLFTCTLCDFQTSDVDVLKAHGDSHNALPTVIRPFFKNGIKNDNSCSADVMIQCTECGFIAQEKSTMTNHMWNHLKKDIKLSSTSLPETPAKSEFCLPFTKVLKSSFLSSFTPSALTYKCTECSFVSKEANTLFAHMLQHKKTNTLGDIIPSTKQSLLDIGTSVTATVTTTTTTTTTMEDSISSLSLSTTSESNLGNSSSDSVSKASFFHDQVAKHFQCTICGYTCELQRTIKAHIWKHSGHRDVDYPMFQNGPLSIYENINKHKSLISNFKTKDKRTCQASSLNNENPVSQVSKISTSSCPQNVPDVQTVVTTTMTDIGNLHNESLIISEDSSVVTKLAHEEKDKSKISKTIEVHSRPKTQKPIPSKSLVLSSCSEKKTVSDQISNKPNLMNVTPMDNTNGSLSLMEFKENTKIMPKRRNCDSTENAFYQPLRKKNCTETFSTPPKDLLEQERSPRTDLDKIPKEGDILNSKNQSSTENNNEKNIILMSSEKKLQKSQVVKINKTKINSISLSENPILEETTDDQSLPPAPTLEVLATSPKNLCSIVPENKQNKQSLEICSLSDIASENREEKKSGSVEKDERHDEESAVALLSLLKHLSTFKSRSESLTSNPTDKCSVTTPQPVNASVPLNSMTTVTSGIANVTTTVTMTTSDVKPKMGISSSLLAVIEQLREHSKLDNEKSNNSFSNQPHTKHNDDNGSGDKISLAPTKKSKKIFTKTAEEDVLQIELKNIEQIQETGDSEMRFRCKLCHYTNANRNQLLQHMRFHCAKKPFECSFCEFVAKSSSDLQNHMMRHCKLRTFQCKLCPMNFNCKSQLRAHMNTHCKEEPFVCKYCKFEADSLVAYQEHLLQMHTKKAAHFCNSCKEHFLCKQDLQNHQKTTCNGRKKTNSSDEYCSNKLNIEQNSKVTGAELACCTKCGQSFSSSIEKEKHARLACCKEWLCQKCNFSSTSFATFQNHMQLHCNSKSSLKCNMCNFTAVSSRSLKSHMKRHVNDQHLIHQLLEQYKCNLCGYVCHHLPSLKSHMWRHASDKNYSYAFTNEVINEAIDYDSHLEHFVDSEEESGSDTNDHQNFLKQETANTSVSRCMVTFRCCQCGFETINKAALNNHMKSHVDVIQQTLDVYRTSAGNNQQPFLVEMNSVLNKRPQDDNATSLQPLAKIINDSTK